jgi:hypothetical protein
MAFDRGGRGGARGGGRGGFGRGGGDRGGGDRGGRGGARGGGKQLVILFGTFTETPGRKIESPNQRRSCPKRGEGRA